LEDGEEDDKRMNEQLEQVIKQLESWSENHAEISVTVEIGFFALALEGSLAVFEDPFVFESQFCRLLFQFARCSDVSCMWQEIGSEGYWIVKLRHPSGIVALYETRVPITRH
jgi:hypothetical protein